MGPKLAICPKCHHRRQPGEQAPDWQCPKCGVAYAKAGAIRAASLLDAAKPEKVADHQARGVELTPWMMVASGCIIAGGGLLVFAPLPISSIAALSVAGVVFFTTYKAGKSKQSTSFSATIAFAELCSSCTKSLTR